MSTEQEARIGDRLAAILAHYGQTAYQMAGQLGYDRPNRLYNLIRHEVKPSYETLVDLLTAYPEVRAEWLLMGTKPMLHPDSNKEVPKKGKQPNVTGQAAFGQATSAAAATSVAKRLANRHIVLPEPPAPGGSYESVRVLGGVAYVAIQFPFEGHKPVFQGRLGRELTTEQGREAAKLCALNVLAQLEKYVGLDQVVGLNRIEAHMATTEGWDEFPQVLDAASDLFLEALGPEVGRHSRALYGVERLPLNLPISLTATFTVRPAN